MSLSNFKASQKLKFYFIYTLKGHIVPEVDVHVPETQVFGEAALVSIMAAVSVESGLWQGAADMSVPSQELAVNSELEEPVTHEEADEIPEVNDPISAETETEPFSTNSISDDKVSTLEVEEQQHVLLSPESHEAAYIELNDDIPLAAADPGPEVVAAVVAPVLGTFELQPQHSTEVSFIYILSAGSLFDCKQNHEGRPYR